LFLGNYPLLLDIELRPFVLENFFTHFLMLANAVRVELSSAALPAHFKSRWIVLLNFLLAGSYIKLISVIVVIVAV
jgi:hypothetical protein